MQHKFLLASVHIFCQQIQESLQLTQYRVMVLIIIDLYLQTYQVMGDTAIVESNKVITYVSTYVHTLINNSWQLTFHQGQHDLIA